MEDIIQNFITLRHKQNINLSFNFSPNSFLIILILVANRLLFFSILQKHWYRFQPLTANLQQVRGTWFENYISNQTQ